MKLYLTKGLPASGKTTWANKAVIDSQGKTININKDDLRSMLHADKTSKNREAFVIKAQETLTKLAFEEGFNVIWSDTNLNPIHEKRAKTFSDRVEVVDFTNVSVQECILRDKNRAKPVGDKVIRQQYNKWLRQEPKTVVQDASLPKACIFDLDGTLFNKSPERGYFEWDKVHLDTPKDYVANLARIYKGMGYQIILLSGRKEQARPGTIQCLNQYSIPFDDLFMRGEIDDRDDGIVKRELFEKNVLGKYYVECVVDDRPKVVRTWFELGLNVFSVNHPDNEF